MARGCNTILWEIFFLYHIPKKIDLSPSATIIVSHQLRHVLSEDGTYFPHFQPSYEHGIELVQLLSPDPMSAMKAQKGAST